MSLSQLELSLMAFPQSWNPATNTLTVNVLLMPVGDPTAPLGTGPKFAGTSVHLSANIVASLAALPTPATTPTQVHTILCPTAYRRANPLHDAVQPVDGKWHHGETDGPYAQN